MSAGTVVITGGILAAVILLCIVAVLCYCRLQYYCCRRPDSESDGASMVAGDHHGIAAAHAHAHSDCKACSALAMDGTAIAPISLDRLDRLEPRAQPPYNHCPNCSPFSLRAGLINGGSGGGGGGGGGEGGGERLGFHTYYENLPLPPPPPPPLLPLTARHRSYSPLSYYSSSEIFPPPPPRPYSTQV